MAAAFGCRLIPQSYRVLKRWIAQGTPFGKPEDPQVARIEVIPDACG